MSVAVYLRVATLRQVHAQTAEQQLQGLQDHLQTKSWRLPQENIFRDDGYSGTRRRRPGLDRLRDKAAAAEFDVLLITDPDRLARNYVPDLLEIGTEFKRKTIYPRLKFRFLAGYTL